MISFMVAERSSSKLPAHRSHRYTKDLAPWRAHTLETALADAVKYTVNMNMESASLICTYLRFKGTAKVKFKVVDGTEPTLSMTMLVANENKLVFRGENAGLITAKGETAPLTSVEKRLVLEDTDQQL